MSITDTDRYIIWSGVIIFSIFGLFGNLNVIYAHYRLRALRTKYGILLTMLVSAHSICLIFELIGVVYDVTGVPIIRKTCFFVLSPYIFTNCAQMALMAAISIDMFISIAFPLRHRTVQKKLYLMILVSPSILYGITVVVLGIIYMDYAVIALCQPPSSLPDNVTSVWYLIGFIFNAMTVVSYIASFTIIYCKKRNETVSFLIYFILTAYMDFSAFQTQQSRTEGNEKPCSPNYSIHFFPVRQWICYLTINIFICMLIFMVIVNVLGFYKLSKEVIERAQAYMVFSALTVCSSTFYVCFICSTEYRRIFWGQIVEIFGCCGIKLVKDRFGISTVDQRFKQKI